MIPSRFLSSAFLAALAFLLASCSSGPDRGAVEAERRAVQPMVADDAFFEGKVTAHLTLGSTLAEHRGQGKGPGGAAGGGRAHRGGGRRGGGGYNSNGSGMSNGEVASAETYAGDGPGVARPRYADSPMPPALLRLTLENKSSDTIEVEIRDLNSELGNFATRPDKFTLQPGAAGEPDAMQSLLGVDSLALPVTLVLRANGKTESKVLTLRPVPPAPAAPAP